MTVHITQGPSGRFEEYITLRQEMLELLAFSRQVLYWTAVFVVGAVAWYMSNYPDTVKIGPLAFSLFLGGSLILPYVVYGFNLNQILRIGSFLAVFWESRDPERALVWHRFHRRGRVGIGAVPEIGAVVMGGTAFFVGLVPPLMFRLTPPVAKAGVSVSSVSIEDVVTGVLVGVAEAIVFSGLLLWGLRKQRVTLEEGWRAVKGSVTRQAAIHDYYEPQNVGVIDPATGQRDKGSSSGVLPESALATSAAVLIGLWYIGFLVLKVASPGAFRFLLNVRFFGADIAWLFPTRLSIGAMSGTIVTLVIGAWVFVYAWAWLSNRLSKMV